MDEVERQIKNFIGENFFIGRKISELNNDASFLDEGIIDSTGMLELVAFVEDTYGVVVEDEELIPDNLDSVNRIIAFLERKGCLTSKG